MTLKATHKAPPHPVLRQYYEGDGDRQAFVTTLFDGTARHYDRLCGVMSLGSGQLYRRQVLARVGVQGNVRILDVATGTGLVARSARQLLGDQGVVVGLDPSRGMLAEAVKAFSGPLVQGTVERLPFADEHFDFVSMGYALRHMADLEIAFSECRRVLKPKGRLVVLEISRPDSAVGQWALRVYLWRVLPLIMRLTGGAEAGLLIRYYWDTIAACVPPTTILTVLQASGFVDVERRVTRGLLSEYVAVKPRG